MGRINITRVEFRGAWNRTIRPIVQAERLVPDESYTR